MRRIQPVRALVVAAGCAASLAACEVNLNTEGMTSTDTRTFNLTGEPDLTLETFDGSIEVHSWDRGDVEVEIEKRAMEQALLDEMQVQTEQDGNRVTLRVTGPSRRENRGITVGVYYSPSARLRVAVPRRGTFQIRTEDGAIRVENLDGRVVLRTGDGSVTADRLSGDIEIRTGDGAIRMQQAAGRLVLDTDDGSVTVDGTLQALRAATGDGSIRVNLADGSAMTEAWDLSTRDGSVTLRLPEGFDAELDAETGDGRIRSSYPGLDVDGGDGDERRRAVRELRTRIGDGGPLLKVRTGDGSIQIER